MAGLGRHPLGTVEREEISAEGVDGRQKGRDHAGPIQDLEQRASRRPAHRERPPGWRPCSKSRPRERRPASARQPNKNVQCVTGISRRKPPKRRMSIVCMACITLPAPRNNRALKKACVNRWNMPAQMPASVPMPSAEEHVAQLADRRIGQHAFQIGLRQGDDAGHQGRERADRGHDVLGTRAIENRGACSGSPCRRRP